MNPASRSISAIACVLVCAAVIVINQSAVHWRAVMPDDYLFAYYGWRTSEGARPYLDVWDHKPPGIWWVNALGFLVCGPGRGAELLICGAAMVCVFAGTLAIVRTACGRSALLPAALLSGPVLASLAYECGADRTETFVAAADALGVAIYLHALAVTVTATATVTAPGLLRRSAWFAAAGATLGLGVWFKQSGAAAPIACASHAMAVCLLGSWRSRSKSASITFADLACMIFGAGIPTVVGVAVLARHEALGPAWQAVVVHNRTYFEFGDASWTAIPHAVRQYLPWLGPLTPLGLAAIGCWSVCAAYRPGLRAANFAPGAVRSAESDRLRSFAYRHALAVTVLWFVFTAYLICVATGRQNYHVAPLLTPAVVLTVLSLGLTRAFDASLRSALQRPVVACVVAGLAAAGTAVWASEVETLQAIWRRKPAWWSLEESVPRSEMVLAHRVRSLTSDKETVFVWGWNPGVYRFAYRANAVRFATNEQAQHAGASASWMEDEVEATILARPPATFVISEGEWRGLCAARPRLTAMIEEAYRYVETLHDKRIYVREPQSPQRSRR